MSGLEISGFASPTVNQNQAKCESLNLSIHIIRQACDSVNYTKVV